MLEMMMEKKNVVEGSELLYVKTRHRSRHRLLDEIEVRYENMTPFGKSFASLILFGITHRKSHTSCARFRINGAVGRLLTKAIIH